MASHEKIDRNIWPRAFAHIDMMSFFAAIEQRDFPELASRAVAIVNGESGSSIIASSYHAKKLGITVGTKVRDALVICPNLVVRAARSARYAEISTAIMEALAAHFPDMEIYSVDECWLELTSLLDLYPSIQAIVDEIRCIVDHVSGHLPCTIGISEGKLTAKFCGELLKGGTTIVSVDKIAEVIGQAPISAICGIGRNIEQYLHGYGIYYCHDLKDKPISILSSRFGNIGRRLYYTCLGHDPEPLSQAKAPKSMGHGKVLPPNTRDQELVSSIFYMLCEKLSARLRANDLQAKYFFVGIAFKTTWLHEKIELAEPTHDSQVIWSLARNLLKQWDGKAGVFRLQITATQLLDSTVQQLNLFEEESNKQAEVDRIKDQINAKFGKNTLLPASVTLQPQKSFEVIAPAWRPAGPRKSV